MPATIVVGGQYGSEGKGKAVALLADNKQQPWIVRCGGPNSGHTVTINDREVILRQVPSCARPRDAILCLSAGCAIDEAILVHELDMLRVERSQFIIDPRAILITDEDRNEEREALGGIASTCSGTGAALIRRMSRQPGITLAGDSAQLRSRCRVEEVAPLLHAALQVGEDVIVEGTQGFSLSLLHGPDYPYVTSRDTTAAGFAMEAGLSPRCVDAIVMVVRTYPIRVGGPSGPFKDEVSWETVRGLSRAPTAFPEYTSVTNRLRRVARFDLEAVKRACMYNLPTSLAVMGLDRLNYANTDVTDVHDLTQDAVTFIAELEAATGVTVSIAGTGFGTFDAIRLDVVPRSAELLHA